MAKQVYINPNTSLVSVNVGNADKDVFLPLVSTSQSEGRILYIKSRFDSFVGTTYNLTILTSDPSCTFYGTGVTSITLSTQYQCVMLQSISPQFYTILNVYQGWEDLPPSYTTPNPASVAVYPSSSNSILFVDLTSQSKTVILPSLATLGNTTTNSFYYLIKDIAGNALTNPLYISTTDGSTFDERLENLYLNRNGVAIEIAADINYNRWYILNYYKPS
jgi:hypothetical protein